MGSLATSYRKCGEPLSGLVKEIRDDAEKLRLVIKAQARYCMGATCMTLPESSADIDHVFSVHDSGG